MMENHNSLTIGRITGVHGLSGNLKVWPYIESIETFSPGRKIVLKSTKEEKGQCYPIYKVFGHKKNLLLSLEGIDDRKSASLFIGKEILIDRVQLPELEEESWYWKDLLGLEVYDHKKGFIGKVIEIFPTGANDVLVVQKNEEETLVAMHKLFVDSVDIENRTMKTTLPEEPYM